MGITILKVHERVQLAKRQFPLSARAVWPDRLRGRLKEAALAYIPAFWRAETATQGGFRSGQGR